MKGAPFIMIPEDVCYDDRLPMGARLLAGEIILMSRTGGECTAKNQFFGDQYGVNEVTAWRWIKALADNGYIEIETNGPKRIIRPSEKLQKSTAKMQSTIAKMQSKHCKNAIPHYSIGKVQGKRGEFIRPHLTEVIEYFRSKGLNGQADAYGQKFWKNYESKGWKNIVDWKARADLWLIEDGKVSTGPISLD